MWFLILHCFAALFLDNAHAQTTNVIPANEAAAHVNQYATVEELVAKVFTSKSGNTFLNIGAAYPNQTFTGWIPPPLQSLNHRCYPKENTSRSPSE